MAGYGIAAASTPATNVLTAHLLARMKSTRKNTATKRPIILLGSEPNSV